MFIIFFGAIKGEQLFSFELAWGVPFESLVVWRGKRERGNHGW